MTIASPASRSCPSGLEPPHPAHTGGVAFWVYLKFSESLCPPLLRWGAVGSGGGKQEHATVAAMRAPSHACGLAGGRRGFRWGVSVDCELACAQNGSGGGDGGGGQQGAAGVCEACGRGAGGAGRGGWG